MSKTFKFTRHGIPYFLSNPNPELLIVSGTHGDEYQVIECVEEVVQNSLSQLSPFLFIPQLSPSAVKQQTRKNSQNADMNRVYDTPEDFDESKDLTELLKPFHFKTYASFHEDLEYDGFYFYDSSDISESKELAQIRENILNLGVPLFDGMDDPSDTELQYAITNGYRFFDKTRKDGTLSYWLHQNNIAERTLEIEVPGKLPLELKRKIVEVIFQQLLLA